MKRHVVIFPLLLAAMCAGPACLPAQAQDAGAQQGSEQRPRFSFGAAAELNFFNGDIQDNSTTFGVVENKPSLGGAAVLEYHAMQWEDIVRLNLLGRVGYHHITLGAGAIEKSTGTITVRNKIVDITTIALAELFPDVRVHPFLMVGFGAMFYDPKRKVTGDVQERYPVYLAGVDRLCLTIPVGIGVRATITRAIDVFAAFQKFYAYTDVLDAWQVGINDNIAVLSAGVLFTLGLTPAADNGLAAPVPVQRSIDTDNDGLTDDDETRKFRTDPAKADSDGDGLTDGEELRRYSTDPLQADTDRDGLSDFEEVRTARTDPLRKDSDEDGCEDGRELREMHTDPLLIDTDGDGITDCDEVTIYLTNPLVKDTDGDGIEDGAEVRRGMDPLKKNN